MAAAIPYAVMAIGAIYAGQQQKAAMRYEAKVADDNALTARRQANAAEEQARRTMRLRLGEQRASAAQSGFDSSDGSLASLQVQSASNAELDALTTRYTGQLQSLSFDNQASGLRANASAAGAQGFLNAAGSLAGGYARYGSALKFGSSSTVGNGSSTVGMSY